MSHANPRRTLRSTAPVVAGVLAGSLLAAAGLFATLEATPVEAAPTPLPQVAPGEFPTAWYFLDRKTGARYEKPIELEGKPAPELKLRGWIGKPVTMKELEGNVVVVDFWATWCGPCMRALPENVKMVEEHGDDGLTVIGVHDAKSGHQKMAAVAKASKLNYPIAIDDGGVSTRAWKVSFWPTYAVVDHKGIVRAAGLRPDRVENVVKILLEERKRDRR